MGVTAHAVLLLRAAVRQQVASRRGRPRQRRTLRLRPTSTWRVVAPNTRWLTPLPTPKARARSARSAMASHHLLGELLNERPDENLDRGQPALTIGWALRWNSSDASAHEPASGSGRNNRSHGNLYSGDPAPGLEQGWSGSARRSNWLCITALRPGEWIGCAIINPSAPLIRAPLQERCDEGWIGRAPRREVPLWNMRREPAERSGRKGATASTLDSRDPAVRSDSRRCASPRTWSRPRTRRGEGSGSGRNALWRVRCLPPAWRLPIPLVPPAALGGISPNTRW